MTVWEEPVKVLLHEALHLISRKEYNSSKVWLLRVVDQFGVVCGDGTAVRPFFIMSHRMFCLTLWPLCAGYFGPRLEEDEAQQRNARESKDGLARG